jgi:hypothetical protein
LNVPPESELTVDPILSWRLNMKYMLTITAGRAWITQIGRFNDVNPDFFLEENDSILIPAGQHVVVEAWPRYAGDVLKLKRLIAYDAPVVQRSHQRSTCLTPNLSPVKTT